MFGIYHRMRFFDLKVRLQRHTLTSVKEVWLAHSAVYSLIFYCRAGVPSTVPPSTAQPWHTKQNFTPRLQRVKSL